MAARSTTFSNKDDETVKLIGVFPGNKLTLTNLDTDKSITLGATGQFHAELKRDGSGFMLVAGHGPSVPHPITGEPGIWYLSGRLNAAFDADGNQTSLRSTGQLINLCTQLGGEYPSLQGRWPDLRVPGTGRRDVTFGSW